MDEEELHERHLKDQEDALKQAYLDARLNGAGPHTAARLVGTTKREMDRYISLDDEFADAIEEVLAERLERVEANAWQAAIEDREQWAIKLVLESHAPHDWVAARDINLRIGRTEEELDIADLHRRLEAQSDKPMGELARGEEAE